MSTQLTATVVDGTLKLDQPVELPNNSRVSVVIEPIAASTAEQDAAWESFLRRIKEHPIDSGGQHFTRDELHERR